MGKATILPSGARDLERGQYYVRIEKDSTRAEWAIQRLSRDLDALSGIISTNYSSYQSAQNAHSQAKSDLNQIIQQGKESPSDDANDKIKSATQAERSTALTLANARAVYQMSRTKEESIRRRIRYLKDQTTIEDTRVVWCADCNQTLQEGDSVGTIEIPNTDDSIMIKPTGTDVNGSDYDSEIDGILTNTAALTPAQAFHSYAVFPGWQRWKPTYRLGKILEKTGRDNATILLDAESTVQSLKVDNARYIYNVPLTLKGQKSGPYEIGDRVVVKFEDQNHESPKVVGFEEDPCTTSTTTTTTSTCSCTSTTLPGEFVIKFTRGDGAAINEDWFTGGALPDYIDVTFKDSSKVTVSMTRTYDAVTGYFTFVFPIGHTIDPNGYWIYCNGYRSFLTFFPSTYKTSQWYSAGDLLSPGTYEFEVPYWLAESIIIGDYNSTYTLGTRVYSSASYDIEYHIFGSAGRESFSRRKRDYYQPGPFDCCEPLGYWLTFDEALPYTTSVYVSGGGLSHTEGGAGQAGVNESSEVAGTLSPVIGSEYTMTAVNNTPDQRLGYLCTCGSVTGQQYHYFVSNIIHVSFSFGASVSRFPWQD